LSQSLDRSALDALGTRWEAAWIRGEGFSSCCTADIRYEDPVAHEPIQGLDALEAHAAQVRHGFPDLRLEPTAARLTSGTHACLPWRVLGTHRGDLPSLPASRRFVILHGLHYVELEDDNIRRARGFFDLYDAGVQLGLLPPRGGLGETALLLLRGFGLRPKG